MNPIEHVHGRQVLDSRGEPTVEVEIRLRSGAVGRVPAGVSTGGVEARDLRDGGPGWFERGVTRAVAHVERQIADAIRGLDATDQAALVALDGTAGFHRLGANAVLGVSLAAAHAAAAGAGQPLWEPLSNGRPPRLPLPAMNVLDVAGTATVPSRYRT